MICPDGSGKFYFLRRTIPALLPPGRRWKSTRVPDPTAEVPAGGTASAPHQPAYIAVPSDYALSPVGSRRPSGTKAQAVEVNRISARLPAMRIAAVMSFNETSLEDLQRRGRR